MTKTDQELVGVLDERIEDAINVYGSLKFSRGADKAKEILVELYGSHSIANLLELAWVERRSFAVTLDMLGSHFESF